MEANQPDLDAVRAQIEYYLSDNNLRHDKFFHNLISQSEEGYIPMETLLRCKKLAALTSDPEVVKRALAQSSEAEAHPDGNSVRRAGNRALPALGLKRDRPEVAPEKPANILRVTTQEETKVTWKELKTAFQARYAEVDVTYVRFTEGSGHIGLPGSTSDEALQEIVTSGLEIEGVPFSFQILQGADLTSFWREFGSHYDLCCKGPKKKKGKSHSSITMGGKNFRSAAKLRTYLRTLLSATAEDQEVDPQYHGVLLDVLKLHPNYQTKYQGFQSFSVGRHPTHPETRCFFVVREDGTKEDFSIAKCLVRI